MANLADGAERKERNEWERVRWLGYLVVKPYSKIKTLKELTVFPWEQSLGPSADEIQQIKRQREEAIRKMDEEMKEKWAKKVSTDKLREHVIRKGRKLSKAQWL